MYIIIKQDHEGTLFVAERDTDIDMLNHLRATIEQTTIKIISVTYVPT